MVRRGHVVMLCALVLLTIGVVMVQSAGMSVRPLATDADPTAAAAVSGVSVKSLLTSRTSLYLLIAVGAMAIATRLPVRRIANRLERVVWFRPGGDMGVLVIASAMLIGMLLLVYVPGIARVKNGSARWINLHLPGLESVQPSEIAKWAIIILVAWYAARLGSYKEHKLKKFFSGLLPVCLCAGLVAAVVIKEDLGTGALMIFATAIVLLAAGARWAHFAAFIPAALVGLIGAIIAAPYRVTRITTFLNPYADPAGDGYHMIQSMSTVAGGGIFGRGLGNGLQKFGYLPEDTTDFLFAVVCEELGLIGAIIVISAYAGIVWTGTSIAIRERCKPLQLIVLGVIATFAIQALINLVVVTGLGPTKGIALPLMSSGGSGWIMTAFMLGLIVSIERTQEYSALYVDHAADDEAADFALRTTRGSIIEAKPTPADRAVLFDTTTATAAHAGFEEPQPEPEIQDEEFSELFGESEPKRTPGIIARLRDRVGIREQHDEPDNEPELASSSAREAGYSEDESERADLFS
jgi:cell division protein FtsW